MKGAQEESDKRLSVAEAAIGTAVEVHSLQKQPELNGALGVVVGVKATTGRLHVRLFGGEEVALKPVNIKTTTAAAAAAQAVQAAQVEVEAKAAAVASLARTRSSAELTELGGAASSSGSFAAELAAAEAELAHLQAIKSGGGGGGGDECRRLEAAAAKLVAMKSRAAAKAELAAMLDANAVTFQVRASNGEGVFYKIQRDTPLARIMEVYAQREGSTPNANRDAHRFTFAGNPIVPITATPDDLGMEDGAVIEVAPAAPEHLCAGCGQDKPKAAYSKNQLSKKNTRRCKACVSDAELRAPAPATPGLEPEPAAVQAEARARAAEAELLAMLDGETEVNGAKSKKALAKNKEKKRRQVEARVLRQQTIPVPTPEQLDLEPEPETQPVDRRATPVHVTEAHLDRLEEMFPSHHRETLHSYLARANDDIDTACGWIVGEPGLAVASGGAEQQPLPQEPEPEPRPRLVQEQTAPETSALAELLADLGTCTPWPIIYRILTAEGLDLDSLSIYEAEDLVTLGIAQHDAGPPWRFQLQLQ